MEMVEADSTVCDTDAQPRRIGSRTLLQAQAARHGFYRMVCVLVLLSLFEHICGCAVRSIQPFLRLGGNKGFHGACGEYQLIAFAHLIVCVTLDVVLFKSSKAQQHICLIKVIVVPI